MKRTTLISLLLAATLIGCGQKQQKTAQESLSPAAFSADSAYAYTATQVAFGARVPGSPAHQACLNYLSSTLERYGLAVTIQRGSLPDFEGKDQAIANIIAAYRPDIQSGRILLCAHWDCRPWSDQETDPIKQQTPVLGANDGASGTAVLLEIARQLQLQQPNKGIDIILFDAEDKGTPDWFKGPDRGNTWCLGSQLWAAENTQQSKQYAYGILLDMVGSPEAVFCKEYFSLQYAAEPLNHVWNTARQLGFARYFRFQNGGAVTDDHYYINTLAHIPCINIIHYDAQTGTGFPEYWHTNHDDMSNVSRSTLDAVGKTVLTAIIQ